VELSVEKVSLLGRTGNDQEIIKLGDKTVKIA
jgi:hypothetical protein